MAIKSKKTFRLVLPEMAPGSHWTFRMAKRDGDDAKVAQLTTKHIMSDVERSKIRREVAEAERKGLDVEDVVAKYVDSEQVMSPKHVLLQVMSQTEPGQKYAWAGDEFLVPEDEQAADEEGNDLVDTDGNPILDDYAGKVPPATAFYISKHGPDFLDEVLRVCKMVWRGRTPEEAMNFRPDRASVGEPGRGSEHQDDVPDAPRDIRVPPRSGHRKD